MYIDTIDTRDLVDELSDLGVSDWENPDLESLDDEDTDRAVAIIALFNELSGYAGDRPEDGIQLIADSYFTQAMKELVYDTDWIHEELPWWIENNIDWDGVADDLRVDYTSVEFDGTTYWYR